MGGAIKKCADVDLQKGSGAAKPLDASSSEEEEEEDSEEDDEDDEQDEEEKMEAEQALNDALKRGKTQTFKEAIAHASSLGLDEDKIRKAEQKLEEHKIARRREVFEAELREFLDNEDMIDLDSCNQMMAKAKEFSVSDKLMRPLSEKLEELDLGRALDDDEVNRSHQIVECLTRSFVASCVSEKGRPVVWVDLEAGSKKKGTCRLDLTLKNLKVEVADTEFVAKVDGLTCSLANSVDEIAGTDGFDQLKEDDRNNAVAVVGENEQWCFIESDMWGQDEMICAMRVLNCPIGAGGGKKKKKSGGSPRSPSSPSKDKKDKKKSKEEEVPDDAGRKSGRKGTTSEPKEKKEKKKSKKEEEAVEEEEGDY